MFTVLTFNFNAVQFLKKMVNYLKLSYKTASMIYLGDICYSKIGDSVDFIEGSRWCPRKSNIGLE